MAAYNCLLAYVLDAAMTTVLGENLMADQTLVDLKEKVITEALFHDLMIEAAAVARSTSVH